MSTAPSAFSAPRVGRPGRMDRSGGTARPFRAVRFGSACLRGITLVEIMVVVAVIAALVGILLPALGILRRNGQLVASQSNLRSIGALMTAYSLDNRDHIVPSQFDYSGPFAKTIVRTASPAGTTPNTGQLRRGSWTDILWTTGKFGPLVPVANPNDPGGEPTEVPSPTWDYRYDSPDYWAYTNPGMVDTDPFRSKVGIQKAMRTDTDADARPFGAGASIREQGQPGYFAANDFFSAVPNAAGSSNWYTNAMIKYPGMSMYAVDSRAGETIPLPDPSNTQTQDIWRPASLDCEVEFRYVGDVCCMLYLDAHVATMGKWVDLQDLRNNRQTRVERLDQQN